jgi:hypothetical protein
MATVRKMGNWGAVSVKQYAQPRRASALGNHAALEVANTKSTSIFDKSKTP